MRMLGTLGQERRCCVAAYPAAVTHTEIPIAGESIRLGQLLKFASVVEDGADARAVIEAGEVEVNGEVDTRRGRQVRPGDMVTYAGETFAVVAEA